jgi:hypothetical protein
MPKAGFVVFFALVQHVASLYLQSPLAQLFPETIFLVMCDPSMNEL